MNYTQAINYIHSIPKFVRPLGNANLEKLLDCLKNPHIGQKYIHIAGTNGKGSTAAMISSVLCEQGYKTGLFTSPFIEVFNERIQINGENISDEDLVGYVERVKTEMEKNNLPVSEFAFICAVAFLYFKEQKCDFVVLEVGMGGRLDATNIIEESEVSVLASISFDHMQFLGETVEEIALEKCGIIKQGGRVVSYPNEDVKEIIKNEAQKQGASLTFADKPTITDNGFIYRGKEYALSLKGAYQPYNAATALEALCALRGNGVEISDTAIEKGLANAKWPVRFEFIKDNLVLDGGHNADGIAALKKSLEALNKDIILVMAMMQDKSCKECVENICSVAKYMIATEIDMPRCMRCDELKALATIDSESIKNQADAVKKALDIAKNGEVVCVCGSLYLAGEIKKEIKKIL